MRTLIEGQANIHLIDHVGLKNDILSPQLVFMLHLSIPFFEF